MTPAQSLILGVPVLNRYDHLARLLASVSESTALVTVAVVDNGAQFWWTPECVAWAAAHPIHVLPPAPGVAASWNAILRKFPHEGQWLIVNDDVVFEPTAIQQIIDTPGAFVSPLATTCDAFSCFLIRSACLQTVGEFDESISPGYAYFEDNDYAHRMYLAGLDITPCDAKVQHWHSQTLAQFDEAQMAAHHKKFEIAKANITRKWGMAPERLCGR